LDWKRELVIAHLVKQKVAEVDEHGLWENTLPEVAASEEELRLLEARLGYKPDQKYREFLQHANGWQCFVNNIDIFGVNDFTGGAKADRATRLIDALEPLDQLCGYDRADLLPVAVSSDDIDVMLMTRPHAAAPGTVFWFAGGLIETYPAFDEWFLAMVDCNRLNFQRLVEGRGS